MGVAEREYMSPSDPSNGPGESNLPWGFIAVVAVVTGVLISINQFSGPLKPPTPVSSVEQQIQRMVERQSETVLKIQEEYSQHEQLLKIAPLDINSATYQQLRLLPRIRHAIAEGIISGRPYSTLEELDDVYGIGPKTIQLIRPHVFVESAVPAQEERQAAPNVNLDSVE